MERQWFVALLFKVRNLLWLGMVVFAQALKIDFSLLSPLEKNEHCSRPGREAIRTYAGFFRPIGAYCA
jgi:hypothetical protein